jgi:hypothetical protein
VAARWQGANAAIRASLVPLRRSGGEPPGPRLVADLVLIRLLPSRCRARHLDSVRPGRPAVPRRGRRSRGAGDAATAGDGMSLRDRAEAAAAPGQVTRGLVEPAPRRAAGRPRARAPGRWWECRAPQARSGRHIDLSEALPGLRWRGSSVARRQAPAVLQRRPGRGAVLVSELRRSPSGGVRSKPRYGLTCADDGSGSLRTPPVTRAACCAGEFAPSCLQVPEGGLERRDVGAVSSAASGPGEERGVRDFVDMVGT